MSHAVRVLRGARGRLPGDPPARRRHRLGIVAPAFLRAAAAAAAGAAARRSHQPGAGRRAQRRVARQVARHGDARHDRPEPVRPRRERRRAPPASPPRRCRCRPASGASRHRHDAGRARRPAVPATSRESWFIRFQRLDRVVTGLAGAPAGPASVTTVPDRRAGPPLVRRVGEEAREPRHGFFRVEADGQGVTAHERAAEDPGRPARQVRALESGEVRRAHLRLRRRSRSSVSPRRSRARLNSAPNASRSVMPLPPPDQHRRS